MYADLCEFIESLTCLVFVCVLICCRLGKHIGMSFEFVNISSDLPSLAEIQSSYVSLRQICMPGVLSL